MTIVMVILFVACFIHSRWQWKGLLKEKPSTDDKVSLLMILVLFQFMCGYLCGVSYSLEREIKREGKFISCLEKRTGNKVSIEHTLPDGYNYYGLYVNNDNEVGAKLTITFTGNNPVGDAKNFCNEGEAILKQYQKTVWQNDTTRLVCSPTVEHDNGNRIESICTYSPEIFKSVKP